MDFRAPFRVPGGRPAGLLLLLIIPLVPLLRGEAPPSTLHYHWVRTASGFGEQQVNAVAVDAAGGIHVVGQSKGDAVISGIPDSMTLTNAGDWDFFVACYSREGEMLWGKTGGGSQADIALAVATDAEANTLVSGYFRPGLRWAGTVLAGAGREDGFVTKINASGTILWTRTFAGPGDDRANGVATDPAGNVYVTGYFQSGAKIGDTQLPGFGQVDLFLAKFDPAGTLMWRRTAGGTSLDAGLVVAADASGVAVGGYFADKARFESTQLQSAGDLDLVVARYDASGALTWVRAAGGAGEDYPNTVAIASDGSIAIGGYVKGEARFGEILLTGVGQRTFQALYDPQGALSWARTTGGTELRGFSWDGDQAWTMGQFFGTGVFDSQSLTSKGNLDIFLGRARRDGTVSWVQSIGSTNQDNGYGIAGDGNDGAVVVGRFAGPVRFGDVELNTVGGGDGFVARLSPAPLLTLLPKGQSVFPGTAVLMTSEAVGAEPMGYQWFFNDTTPLDGRTSRNLQLDDVALAEAGLYSVVASNRYGTATSPPVNLNVFGIARPKVTIGGVTGTSFDITNQPEVLVTLSHPLPDAGIHYTKDGKPPSLASTLYTGPFLISTSITLRAVAYDRSFSANETVPIPVRLRLSPPEVLIDGMPGTRFAFTNVDAVQVRLQHPVSGVVIRYELDGSLPRTNSPVYRNPIVCTQTVSLRAVASRVGMEAGDSGGVPIRFERLYRLEVPPNPDGSVTLNPPGGIYPTDTEVQLTASARPGWSFLNWSGDLEGTQTRASVVMDRPRSIAAVFGTPLETAAFGGGRVQVRPVAAAYARGAQIEATAIPDLGRFLSVWGGAAGGSANPLVFTVAGAVPSLSAVFSELPADTYAVTVLAEDGGSASRNPAALFYPTNTPVSLVATPDPDFLFVEWRGTRSSTNNPWNLVVTNNVVATAVFKPDDRLKLVNIRRGVDIDDPAKPVLLFDIQGSGSIRWLESSTQLIGSGTNPVEWVPLLRLTNAPSVFPISIPVGRMGPTSVFFRARLP